MNSEELEKITSSITEKIGKENAGLIADDLGTLITRNNEVLNSLNERDTQIEKLKSNNERLINANSNLLQQIPMKKEKEGKQENKSNESFSFKSAFDEKGRFIN